MWQDGYDLYICGHIYQHAWRTTAGQSLTSSGSFCLLSWLGRPRDLKRWERDGGTAGPRKLNAGAGGTTRAFCGKDMEKGQLLEEER